MDCHIACYGIWSIGQTKAPILHNGLSYRTATVYDPAGRAIRAVDPLSEITSTTYYPGGQTKASINPLGFRTTTVYDPAGRTIREVDPLNEITSTTSYAAGP